MDEMFNKIKNSAAKAIDEAENFTKTAVKKTKDVIDQTKYKYSITEIETKINNVLSQLGATLYNEYKEGSEFEGDIAVKCSQIDEFYNEIEEIKSKIAELNNSTVCKNCGAMIGDNDFFCPKCGTKK